LLIATSLVFASQLLSEFVLGADVVLLLGAKIESEILAGEYWRFITPVFIHAGFLHFFINMYSLFAIGPTVERFFAPRRTLALYLMSGIAGVVFSLGLSPYPSVGASGAIFGLLGSLGVFLYQNRSTLGPAAALQLRRIVLIAILNLALGLSPGIDNWGHVGGLIFGAGLAWFIGPLLQVRATESGRRVIIDQRQWNQIWPQMATGVGVLAILAIATII
jgi:rhomboid protease GluP